MVKLTLGKWSVNNVSFDVVFWREISWDKDDLACHKNYNHTNIATVTQSIPFMVWYYTQLEKKSSKEKKTTTNKRQKGIIEGR